MVTRNTILRETTRAKSLRIVEERIVKKSLDIIVLKAVEEEPLSGYDSILLIYKKFGVKLSAGTVYSLLHSLEKRGLIKVNKQKTRHYKLTEKGKKSLMVITIMQNRIRELINTVF